VSPPEGGSAPAVDVEATLRRVELVVTRRLDGLLQGDYQGLLPGHGTELGEARRYEPGDDVRRIDWAVTARTQRTHVRESIADHELETTLLLDRSASLAFGTSSTTKGRLALEVAAAVGFVAAERGNRLGLLAVDGERAEWIRHRTGRAHVHAALRRVGRRPATGEVSLADAMVRTARLARRRGLVVVVSDLLDRSDWSGAIRRLTERHDVLVIEVRDPRELALPAVGVLTVVDPETGRRRFVDTSSGRLRHRFEEAARAKREAIARRVRTSGADHLVLSTDADWLAPLVAHLARRRRVGPRTAARR
jgi:uncharacterized protein (DUF58 family)